jgi:hypothetical protein
MSKMAAIDVAVRQQLANDGKTISYRDLMSATGGYQNTTGTTTTPDEPGIERFLLGVANRLKLDTPSLQFDWTSIDVTKIATSQVSWVISLIDGKTDPAGAGNDTG